MFAGQTLTFLPRVSKGVGGEENLLTAYHLAGIRRSSLFFSYISLQKLVTCSDWQVDQRFPNRSQIPEINYHLARFQVLTATSMKMTVFCDVAPCSLVETDDVSEVLTASITRAMTLDLVDRQDEQ
jgi:hypothetical protein